MWIEPFLLSRHSAASSRSIRSRWGRAGVSSSSSSSFFFLLLYCSSSNFCFFLGFSSFFRKPCFCCKSLVLTVISSTAAAAATTAGSSSGAFLGVWSVFVERKNRLGLKELRNGAVLCNVFSSPLTRKIVCCGITPVLSVTSFFFFCDWAKDSFFCCCFVFWFCGVCTGCSLKRW